MTGFGGFRMQAPLQGGGLQQYRPPSYGAPQHQMGQQMGQPQMPGQGPVMQPPLQQGQPQGFAPQPHQQQPFQPFGGQFGQALGPWGHQLPPLFGGAFGQGMGQGFQRPDMRAFVDSRVAGGGFARPAQQFPTLLGQR